jgi:hypothetical protein
MTKNIGYCKVHFVFLLTLTLLISVVAPLQVVHAQSSDYYHMTYSWNYQGHWTWNIDIPKALYDAYKSVSEHDRTRNGIQGYGFLVTTHDSYIQSLTDKLTQISDENGFSEYEKVSFTLAFVQSLPYTSDDVTTGWDEYPRFPVETLVDNGGDCEDTLFCLQLLLSRWVMVWFSLILWVITRLGCLVKTHLRATIGRIQLEVTTGIIIVKLRGMVLRLENCLMIT